MSWIAEITAVHSSPPLPYYTVNFLLGSNSHNRLVWSQCRNIFQEPPIFLHTFPLSWEVSPIPADNIQRFHYIPNCCSFTEALSQAPLSLAPGPQMVSAYLLILKGFLFRSLPTSLETRQARGLHNILQLELHQPRTCWMRFMS